MDAKIKQIDKSKWGDGPWMQEPDRKEWRDTETGFPCIIRRTDLGHFCGYVGVPPNHPSHGKSYEEVDCEVHGGLTYADKCQGEVCHVPAPGE